MLQAATPLDTARLSRGAARYLSEGLAAALRAVGPLAVAAIPVAVLLGYPPALNSFYPRCPVYELLHLKCPGCGATRALAALLRGQFAEAWDWNALFTLAFPFCVAYGIVLYARWLRGERVRWPDPPTVALYGMLAATVAFTVLRNFPQGRF